MDIKLFVFIVIILFVIIICYLKSNYSNMTYIKSNIDNNYYLVRNIYDKLEAANTLARLRNNILTLSDFLYNNINKYGEYEQYIKRLHEKVKDIIIIESTEDSIYTSYSVNKGEQIVFCLRSRKGINGLHDINLMMYVVLHEIAHVACPIYDNHGPLFRKIFAFLTIEAIKLNLYKKIDFLNIPKEYCGIEITDSII